MLLMVEVMVPGRGEVMVPGRGEVMVPGRGEVMVPERGEGSMAAEGESVEPSSRSCGEVKEGWGGEEWPTLAGAGEGTAISLVLKEFGAV